MQQVVAILQQEQQTLLRETEATEITPAATEIGRAAALHGAEMLKRGFTIDQVVLGYGDVCQSVTELAINEKEPITADEFRTLNRCLDNAIVDAVTSFGKTRQSLADEDAETLHQRLTSFVDEHLRLVEIAVQAFTAIQTGNIGSTGATGTLLAHVLDDLQSLAIRTLPEFADRSSIPDKTPVLLVASN
jgi:hypothetical protein